MPPPRKRVVVAQPPARGRRGVLLVPATACLLAMALVSPGGAVVLLIGTLPALVALIVDGSTHRSLAYAVGGMNLAGAVPYVPTLLALGRGQGAAAIVAVDPWALLTMYAAAACGWLLFALLPVLSETAVIVAEQRRRAQLRDAQAKLVQDWGPEVAKSTSTPV